jgi:hypothetical protein
MSIYQEGKSCSDVVECLFSMTLLQDAPAGGSEVQYFMDHLEQYKSAVAGKGANKAGGVLARTSPAAIAA